MSEYKEGDVVKTPQNQFLQLKGGAWVPYSPDYKEVFKNDERTTSQNVMGALSALNEGAYLGFGDEVVGMWGKLMGDPSVRQGAENIRSDFQERNPVSNFGLEVGGTLLNPLTRQFGARAVAARPILGSGVVGSGFGAAFGAGKAQEGERLQDAGMGALLGFPLGMAGGYAGQLLSQKVIPGIGAAAGRVKDFFTPNVTTADQQANAIIRPFLQKGFESADDPMQAAILMANELGPRGSLMDMSPNVAGLANAMANKQVGGFQAESKRFFDARSKDGMNTIMSGLKKVFGKNATDSAVMQSLENKSTEAGKLFDAAKSQIVPEEKMAMFMSQLDDQMRLNENTSFFGALRKINNSLFSGKGKDKVVKTSVDQLHRVRMDIADDASTAFRNGAMEKWRMLKDLRNSFDKTLPEEYSKAMQLSAQKRQIESAKDLGERFFTTKTADLLEWAADVTEQERYSYMLGMLGAAKEKMGNVTEGGKVSRFFSSPNAKEKLTAIVGGQADDFIRSIENENLFKATENLVIGNSFTHARDEAAIIFDNMVGKASKEFPTSQGEFMRGIASTIIDKIRINKSVNPKVAKSLEAQLLKKGVTKETVEMLMRSPFRDKAAQWFTNTPSLGATGATVGGMAYPSQ